MSEGDGGLRHGLADVGPVRLHYVEAGDGPLVVLLHGFPDFWYSWRRQLPALAAAGYRAVACDLRGYNRSDKPRGRAAYTLPALAADVVGLIRERGGGQAALIGHDWGGAVAWEVAATAPATVSRLAVMNCPHPAVFTTMQLGPGQALRSSYMAFFQLPRVPEALLRAGRFALLRRSLQRLSRSPQAVTRGELDRYVDAWSQPGALTASLNYYRALARAAWSSRGASPVSSPAHIDVPTLVLWGAADPFLQTRLAFPPSGLCADATVRIFEGAGHWVHLDAADEVNDLLISFLEP